MLLLCLYAAARDVGYGVKYFGGYLRLTGEGLSFAGNKSGDCLFATGIVKRFW